LKSAVLFREACGALMAKEDTASLRGYCEL
jgi:hypothetical protein